MNSAALNSASLGAAATAAESSTFRARLDHPDYEVLAVHVNDGYARHGGEGQQRAFTRRQWIGIQTTDVPYPAWTESQSRDQRKIKGDA